MPFVTRIIILKIIFFFLLLMLVFTKSHSLLPRKSIYQRSSYFFQTFTVMLHTVPFIFSCNTSLILMTFPKNNDNNLTMIRMKFSWRRMWIYQLNWKKHCLWGETENVSSSRFTDKISSKKKSVNPDLIHQFTAVLVYIPIRKRLHWGNHIQMKNIPHYNSYTKLKQNNML